MPAGPRRAADDRARHVAVWVLIAATSLWLRSGFPVYAIGDAGLDDALFVRLARNIGAGEWLGPFDETTLVKGAFYPVFILAAFLAGMPLKMAEQGLYLVAAACVARLLPTPGRRTLLFAILAFNPVFWNFELGRVIREGIYGSLALASIGLAVAISHPAIVPSLRRQLGTGGAFGLVFAAFWLTREEGVWLLPALASVFAIGAFGRRATLRPVLTSLAAAAVAGAILVGGNVALNLRAYGIAETVEVKSAPFLRAYGALSRIQQQSWRRYVPVPEDARRAAYRVSPAARELEPFLEGALGDVWRRTSCEQQPEGGCTDILASWLQWALRDAVAQAGHYSSASEAARYYDALATEIDAGCVRDIPCLPPRATLAPPFRGEYLADAIAAALRLAPDLLRVGGPTVGSRPGSGPNDQLDAFEDTVGQVGRPGRTLITLRFGVDGLTDGMAPPRLAVLPPESAGAGFEVRTDLVPAGQGTRMNRLTTDCPVEACTLLVLRPGHPAAYIPLATLLTVGQHDAVTVEAVNQHTYRRGQDRRAALIQRIARPVGAVYGFVAPVGAVIGLLGTILAFVVAPRACMRSAVSALAVASIVAILSRLALVAYLDVTAIRSIGVLYLSAATPFVIVLAVTGTMLVSLARARRP